MVADFPHKGATNLTPLFLHGAASADMTGWSAVLSALLDGLKDGLLSIPILFLAYLLMELLERSSRLNEGLLRRYSRRAGPALGGLLGMNDVSAAGMVGSLANSIPMFGLMKDMDSRGKIINVAFAVSAAFVFGDHLGFTAGFEPDMLVAVICGKLTGGITAVVVAMLLTRKEAHG